jgi:hypothetical protein
VASGESEPGSKNAPLPIMQCEEKKERIGMSSAYVILVPYSLMKVGLHEQ